MKRLGLDFENKQGMLFVDGGLISQSIEKKRLPKALERKRNVAETRILSDEEKETQVISTIKRIVGSGCPDALCGIPLGNCDLCTAKRRQLKVLIPKNIYNRIEAYITEHNIVPER